MKHFYLDNFRGFQDQYLSIKNVNFLVGENSSGKTSFLTLVKLLSSRGFWQTLSFDSPDYGLGHYEAIVSINSKNKTYFRLGFAEDDLSGESGGFAYLLTFKNSGGTPRLYKATVSDGDIEVVLTFTPEQIRYKFDKVDQIRLREFSISDLFGTWKQEQASTSRSGYKVLKHEYGAPLVDQIPLSYVLLMIVQQEEDAEKSARALLRRSPFILGYEASWDVAWIAPIRTKPRRTYDEVSVEFSPEGEHTPYELKKLLDSGVEAEKFRKFAEKFGSESGLFKKVDVHRFGKSHSAPFEVDIYLEKKPLNIGSVGYGVSQALPLVVELFTRGKGAWFSIQQPEVHLHPRAQAAFGELVQNLASNEGKCFVIETHSDFAIDRYRIACRLNNNSVSSQILFFERKNGANSVCPISIDADGNLDSSQPESYRSFFVKEDLKILGML